MKRILYASFFAACAAMTLSSCMNGDYDADPYAVSTTTNPLNQGGTSGGGGTNTSFNWTGSDPMSAKVEGSGWQAATASYSAAATGFPASVTGIGSDNSVIRVDIPTNPTMNTTYSFGNNLSAGFLTMAATTDPNNIYSSGLGGNGQVQIIEEDASHIKGKFYFTGKNTSGARRTVNEGYFNVPK